MRNKSKSIYLLFTITIMICSLVQGESIARIMKAEGLVFVKRLGMSSYDEPGKIGAAINNGDAIKVGEYGFAAVIFLDDRSVVKIKSDSQFEFMDTKNTRSLNIEFGTILNKIEKENRNKTFRVVSPVSVASVKGTEFSTMIDPSGVDQFVGKEVRKRLADQPGVLCRHRQPQLTTQRILSLKILWIILSHLRKG